MIWLNNQNGAAQICTLYHQKVLDEFQGHIYGVVMGIAYGGEIESVAKLWKDRGTIYGYDTFEDLHPKHLAPEGDETRFEATCMDSWYHRDVHGTDQLAYAYQREELDKQGLTNAILIKGEVHPKSCQDIPKIHYAFLDMDMPFSMDQGYKAVRDKIVPGGYLLLHDTQNITTVGDWCKEEVLVKDKDMWIDEPNYDGQLLKVLKRKDHKLHVRV